MASKHLVCCVFDAAIGCFDGPLFLAHSKAAAIRMFSDLANDANSQVAKHPTDYSLFQVGTWDGDTGKLTALAANERLINAFECLKPAS